MNPLRNNKFESNKKYFTICIYALFVILIGALIVKIVMDWDKAKALFNNFVVILSPFLIGAFMAYLLNPLVKRLDGLLKKLFKEKTPRVRKFLSILISYIIVIGIIIIALFRILPQIVTSLTDLIALIPSTYTRLLTFMENFEESYPDFDFRFINQILESLGPDLLNYLKNLVTNVIPVIYTTSVSVIKWIINILIAVIVSAYMLSDQGTLKLNFKRLLYAYIPKGRVDGFLVSWKR